MGEGVMKLDQGQLFVGADVQVVNQDEYQGTFTVAADETIDFEATGPIFVGYGYSSKVTTLPSAASGGDVPVYGLEKRVRSIRPYFLDTVGYTVEAEGASVSVTDPVNLSGFQDTQVLSNFTMDTTFSIGQDLPYPSSLVSTLIELDR